MEKMATYIGTKFGDEAAQEWTSGKRTVLPEPAYSQAISGRDEAQVMATKDRIELKLRGLKAEKAAIQLELDRDPNNRALLKEMREAEDQIAQSEIDLVDEVAMKLTEVEKIAHANAWRTHQETTESLKVSKESLLSAVGLAHTSPSG